MRPFNDPPHMPGTGESPGERLARAVPLAGTPGQDYVVRRGIPEGIANAAGVRFDRDFGGRPAVLVAMRDKDDAVVAMHGRYLHVVRGQDKMLTFGPGGGAVSVLGGWRADPLILVEGLFDALSLAACGWGSVATIGRWAPWLPEVSAGRVAWLAFDAARSGEAEVSRYAGLLRASDLRRLPPPPRCKDWNTALVKRGRDAVARWVRDQLTTKETPPA